MARGSLRSALREGEEHVDPPLAGPRRRERAARPGRRHRDGAAHRGAPRGAAARAAHLRGGLRLRARAGGERRPPHRGGGGARHGAHHRRQRGPRPGGGGPRGGDREEPGAPRRRHRELRRHPRVPARLHAGAAPRAHRLPLRRGRRRRERHDPREHGDRQGGRRARRDAAGGRSRSAPATATSSRCCASQGTESTDPLQLPRAASRFVDSVPFPSVSPALRSRGRTGPGSPRGRPSRPAPGARRPGRGAAR